MNEKDLFSAIGEIDEDKILNAIAPPKRNVTPIWMRWGTIAACAVICLLIGINLFTPKTEYNIYINDESKNVATTYKEDLEALTAKIKKLSFVSAVEVIEYEPISLAVYVTTEDKKKLGKLWKIDPDGKYIKAVYYEEKNERKSSMLDSSNRKELKR